MSTDLAASRDPGSIRVSRSFGSVVWAVALIVAASFIGCLVVFENASFLSFAVNADTLHLALTAWDYSAHDYAREGFSMSRVPSVFPDIVIYSAVQLATGSWRFASLAYGALSLLVLSMVAGFILRDIASCNWRRGAEAFLLLTLLILVLELPMTAASEHMHIFLPNNHGGPFILALAALHVAWSWLKRPVTGKLLLLFALVAAGVLSDLLFVISCVGPTAAALTYSVVRRKISLRGAVPILICLVLGTAAARALNLLLVRDGGIGIDWATVPAHARLFFTSASVLAGEAPLATLLAFALPIAVFLCAFVVFRRIDVQDCALDPVEYWWVLSASSVLATLLATPLVYEGVWHYRYMMPLLWWPIIWTAALILRATGAARGSLVPAGLAGLTVALGVRYFSQGFHTPALLALHHPIETCLSEAQGTSGLKAGLGDYWYSRYIEASSDWRLQVDQIEPDGSGMWWSNDRFWYTHDVHDGTRPPEYNYIVMANLNEMAIRSRYGAPSRTLDCGGSPVWIYDGSAALQQALIRGSPPLYETFLEAGQGIDGICVPADRFLSASHRSGPERLAPLRGPLQASAETSDIQKPQTWGPFFGLPRGRWTIALDYALTSDAPGRDRWDVTAGWGYKTLHEGALDPTDGKMRTVQIDIDLREQESGLEIRSLLAGTGIIEIHGAEIRRTGAPSQNCGN